MYFTTRFTLKYVRLHIWVVDAVYDCGYLMVSHLQLIKYNLWAFLQPYVYRSSFIPNYYSIQASRKSLVGFQQGDYQLKLSRTPNSLWLSQEIIRSALDIWFELEAGSLAAGNSRNCEVPTRFSTHHPREMHFSHYSSLVTAGFMTGAQLERCIVGSLAKPALNAELPHLLPL